MRFIVMILLVLLSGPTLATEPPTYENGKAAYEAGNYSKARAIMEELAANGNAKAMNAIGLYYARGTAYPKDRKKACDWYEKSAKAGYNSAQYNLTFCFENEKGEITDYKSWIYWMETSASNNFKHAQTVLMKHYIRKDKEKSFYWAKKAATQGSVAARVTLWQYDQDQDIEPVTISEIACVWIKLLLLQNYTNSCD